jgi:serine/threonine protein kinase
MVLSTEREGLRSIGNWELFEQIAASGMGTVYKARNRDNGEVAAIKVLPPFQAGNQQAYQRFARECRILSALNDPHIVRALDFGIEGCEPYLVMEYVEGERLGDRVARTGKIPEAEAVRLIAQVAGALDRMHGRKLVHRNVQPDSILITADGQARLTDLCLIKEVESHEALTRDGTCLGTPYFMAPEQFRDAAKAGRRCDIYALAATLYLTVTGTPPYAGCNVVEMCARKMRNDLAPPRMLEPSLSEPTDQAIRRAMNAEPFNRPATCEEFIASLGAPQAPAEVATPNVLPDAEVAVAATASADDSAALPPATSAYSNEYISSAWMWVGAAATVTAFISGFYFLWGH